MEIIESPLASGDVQMQCDQTLIDSLHQMQKPLLRYYSWRKKTCTYGYFIDPEKILSCSAATQLGFDIARRPTGGGLLFHYDDFSFTVCIPRSHRLYDAPVLVRYKQINDALLCAVKEFFEVRLVQQELPVCTFSHLCMASCTHYDLLWQGKKIAGSAQRRTKYGFIHQSTLFLTHPNWSEIAQCWKASTHEFEAMQQHSTALLNTSCTEYDITHFQKMLRASFAHHLQDALQHHQKMEEW